MNSYEKLLYILSKQNKTEKNFYIGTMTSETSCDTGENELSEDDLLIAEHLKTGYFKNIDSENPALKNKDTYVSSLKKDDVVLVIKASQELYVIVERLIENVPV